MLGAVELKDIASSRITFSKVETTAVKLDHEQKDIRLEELIHKHLAWVEANLSPATYKTRKTCLKAFLKFMDACMVSSITRLRLSEFLTGLRPLELRELKRGEVV